MNLPTPWLVLLSPLAPALFVVTGISFKTCSRMPNILDTSRGPSFKVLKSTGPKAFLSDRMVDSASPLLLWPACPVGQKSIVKASTFIPFSVFTPMFASLNSFIRDDCWSVKYLTAGPTRAVRWVKARAIDCVVRLEVGMSLTALLAAQTATST